MACAALWAQAFALYLIALRFLAPPTAANWAQADPVLRLMPAALVPTLGIAVAAAWLWKARPSRLELRRSAWRALLGAAVALTVAVGLRASAGPHLPAFIPAEESAGPGLVLSMTAGYAEEVALRLLLLPILYGLLARRVSRPIAATVAVVATGAVFVLLHGPAPAAWMVTRFVFPGCILSAACFAVGPSFVVSAHCAAHLALPVLFAPG
ncbi:MAG TPA: CPBP family glutamic-type intramembrane protease [Polyangia bacterium]